MSCVHRSCDMPVENLFGSKLGEFTQAITSPFGFTATKAPILGPILSWRIVMVS